MGIKQIQKEKSKRGNRKTFPFPGAWRVFVAHEEFTRKKKQIKAEKRIDCIVTEGDLSFKMMDIKSKWSHCIGQYIKLNRFSTQFGRFCSFATLKILVKSFFLTDTKDERGVFV